MTPQELRELDVWIGENVFGLERLTVAQIDAGRILTDKTFVYEWINTSRSLPNYSTDPAAAMLVLERCASEAVVTVEYDGPSQQGWMVARLNEDGKEDFCQCCETLPIAICQFAKRLFRK